MHVSPHEIPGGDESTSPRPLPCFATVSLKIGVVVVQVYVDGGLVFPNWLVAVTWKMWSPTAGGSG